MHAPTPFIHSRLTLPLLVLVSMMGPLALNIVMAALPGMVHTLATTREMVQLTISLFLLGQAVSQLFVGPLSDRFGRKPVLTISIGVYVLASLGAGMASDISQLIVLRVLQAFGATAGLTLARTIVRDLYPRETAASMIGYVTMGMVVAPMIAPSLGAVLDEAFGWRAIFLACALLGLAAIALTLLILKETRPVALTGATAADVLRRSGELLLNRRFLGYAGASTGASAMFYAFLGAAPFIVVDLMHRPPWEYGAWYVVMAFGYMGGNFLSGRFSRRIGVDRMIRIGNLSAIGAIAAMLLPVSVGLLHPVVLFVPAMLMEVANGLTMPNAIAGSVSVNPRAAGAASGLAGAMQMGAGALASYLAGIWSTGSALPLAVLMFTLAVLTHLATEWGRRGSVEPL